jgi:sigma-B regulation protein RsbU (phosphoserine phosphatase)
VVDAFGVPAGSAEQLRAPDGVLVTMPLATAAVGRAVLAVIARTPPDLADVEQLAHRIARAITAAAVYEERSTLASTLREALVPEPLPSIPGVQLGACYRPAQETTQLGGDFYDVMARADGRWALSIGDVCGKGVDAAVHTGQVRQSLRTAGMVSDDPAATLRLVNDTLLSSNWTTFVTVSYALLEPARSGVAVRLASGGHPPALLLRNDTVTPVTVQGTLIGLLRAARFETTEFTLAPGDVLLFHTDGATEARGPAGLLGDGPIAAILADSGGLTAQAITERLMQLVIEHLHGWPHDDIAILAVRCTSAPETR